MLKIFSRSIHVQLGEWVIRIGDLVDMRSSKRISTITRINSQQKFLTTAGHTGWLALFSGAKIHRFGRHGEVLEGEAKVIDHLAFITQQSAPLPANDDIPF